MRLNEYQADAKATAIYPGELSYPALGLCGEIGELIVAIRHGDEEEISKEIGDVLWYVANVASDADLRLSEVMKRKKFPNHNKVWFISNRCDVIEAMAVEGGIVAENVKKTIRDDAGVLCERRRKNIKKALKNIVTHLNLICWDYCSEVQLEDCAKANIAKLLSRQERGKLTGDGNDR